MKAFHFRLDSALRWRSTQLRLEQENLSRISSHLAALQAQLMAKHTELRSGSAELAASGSAAFASWSAYVDRSYRQIRSLEDQLQQGRKALALQTRKMVEAHQKMRVLENLKRQEHAGWTVQLNRETEAFAGEAFLARATIDKRTGA
jgi:flagellar biosynthesis chaperone FliJ